MPANSSTRNLNISFFINRSTAENVESMMCLNRFCRPIMTKPRPAPAKPATPEAPASPPPQTGEQQAPGGDADSNTNPTASANASTHERAADGSGEVPPASAEPMETDTSTTSA